MSDERAQIYMDTAAQANACLDEIRKVLPAVKAPETPIELLAAELDAVVHEDWASISADDVGKALDKLGLALVKTTP